MNVDQTKIVELMIEARRFPSPWSADELDACFVVKDRDGQKLAYVYFEDEPGRRSAGKLLARDEGRAAGAGLRSAAAGGCRVGSGIFIRTSIRAECIWTMSRFNSS